MSCHDGLMTTNTEVQVSQADIIHAILAAHRFRGQWDGPTGHRQVVCHCRQEFDTAQAHSQHQADMIVEALAAIATTPVAKHQEPKFQLIFGEYEDAWVYGEYVTKAEAIMALGQYMLDRDSAVTVNYFSINEL